MNEKIYFAVAKEGYWCEIPDLPSCRLAEGNTIEELIGEATIAAQCMIDCLKADNEPIPEPSKASDISQTYPGAILIPVETVMPEKTERINTCAPGHYVKLISQAAKKQRISRSDYFIRAAPRIHPPNPPVSVLTIGFS